LLIVVTALELKGKNNDLLQIVFLECVVTALELKGKNNF